MRQFYNKKKIAFLGSKKNKDQTVHRTIQITSTKLKAF